MKKLPYVEGSVILVPLRNGGFARGVVARSRPTGKILLGYFCGPRRASIDEANFNDLDPSRAILRIRFGHLGLINGKWQVRGTLPTWDRDHWPMPDFVRRDPLGILKPRLVRHSNVDPLVIEAEYVIDNDMELEVDSLYGAGAVEIKLTKLLK